MLQKQAIDIAFAEGLDTKTDPKRVRPGKFLALINSIFNKIGLLQKRNGFGPLPSLPDNTSTYLTTFKENLFAIGDTFQAYSEPTQGWVQKGQITPVSLNVLSILRNNAQQTQVDAVVAPNGLICTVYTQNTSGTVTYNYTISDSVTGQNIIAPTTITAADAAYGTPKVFIVGNYFIIVFTAYITSVYHLKYIPISSATPTANTTATDISNTYLPSTTTAFDGVTFMNNLYLSWSDGTNVYVTFLTGNLLLQTPVSFTAIGTSFSLSVDTTNSFLPVVWVSFYDSGASNGYTLAVYRDLTTVLGVTTVFTSNVVTTIATYAANNHLYYYWTVTNTYTYDTGISTPYIKSATCNQAGTVVPMGVMIRSIGIASKVFLIEGVPYYLAFYPSSFQPCYFLMQGLNVVGKVGYQNAFTSFSGGGVAPSVTVSGNTAYIPYLISDLIVPINRTTTSNGTGAPSPVYSQPGINLAAFTFTNSIVSREIANNLHVSGGFLWMHDGYLPVEHNFFLYPDSVEISGNAASNNLTAQTYGYQCVYSWQDNQGNTFNSAPSLPVFYAIATVSGTFTANRTSGSPTLASVSSFTNVQVGQAISGTGIPASTYILSMNVGASTITMSHNASSGTATSTTVTNVTLSSLNVNIPTLRLTYKTGVKIAVYRWSTAQQSYYQVTSISSPTVNNPNVDFITFVDTLSDAQIIGNQLLYTTGGVVEDISAPATDAMTLYNSRFWLIDAENRNTLWYSKEVIEGTPVEMSDLFTYSVAATQGSEGSTGQMTALAAMDDKLIIFKPNAAYYLTGQGPDNTGANSDYPLSPTFITAAVGCSNQNSIVLMQDGLMFQSNKGIWLLGRNLSTNYIGAPVEQYNASSVLSANCIPGTNQVRFQLSTGEMLVYDYFFRQWSVFQGTPGISSCLFQNLHTLINSNGAAFQETPGMYLDGSNAVSMSFTTGWINLAGLQGYQRLYEFYLLGQYFSPHKLQVSVAYDYNSSPTQSVIILPSNYTPNWGGDPNWGANSTWGGPGNDEQWKIATERQRCEAFQISVSEIFDPSFQTPAGVGLTLSGINAVYGLKKPYYPINPNRTTG